LKGVSGKLKQRSDDASKSLWKLALALVSESSISDVASGSRWVDRQEALQRMQARHSQDQFDALQRDPWQRVL
jgi:hypothetical protein